MKCAVTPLALPDVKLIGAPPLTDARGYFAETYQREDLRGVGIDYTFVQDNQSGSKAAGTVRGLHFQIPPRAQTKLVRVLRGRILDVVVDLRRASPSYGRALAIELSAGSGEQVLVPAGFAHGYCTMEPDTEVFYKVDRFYSPEHDRGLNWADPALHVAWPVTPERAVLSERDRAWPLLRDLPSYFE